MIINGGGTMRMYVRLLIIVICIYAAGCGVQKKSGDISGRAQATTASVAPDFTETAITGEIVTLSELKGSVVIINFFATWCPPCKMEIPDFISLYTQYKDRGLAIVGISLDQDGRRILPGFIRNNGINYPVVYNLDLANLYGGIRSIPTTFVVDKEGIIRHKITGYQPKDRFEALITALLRE